MKFLNAAYRIGTALALAVAVNASPARTTNDGVKRRGQVSILFV